MSKVTNVQSHKCPKSQKSKVTNVQSHKCPNFSKVSCYCDINNNKKLKMVTNVQNCHKCPKMITKLQNGHKCPKMSIMVTNGHKCPEFWTFLIIILLIIKMTEKFIKN